MMEVPWRLELFFKSAAELRSQIPFLKSTPIRRVNLPNKVATDDLAASVRLLRAEIPDLDICCHLSCKYQYGVSAAASMQKLTGLWAELGSPPPATSPHHSSPADLLGGHGAAARTSVLLVSGGGKKRAQFDTLAVLKQWAQPQAAPRAGLPGVCVAFNPYLPAGEQQALERQRLSAKLATGLVEAVYVQIGTDLAALRSGLAFLRTAAAASPRAQAAPQSAASPTGTATSGAAGALSLAGAPVARGGGWGKLRVYGSLLLPSKKLLAQMRFRPWNGVFLSDEYLSGVDAAQAITLQVVREYSAHGVLPLIETSVRSSAELQNVTQLLHAYQQPVEASAPAAGSDTMPHVSSMPPLPGGAAPNGNGPHAAQDLVMHSSPDPGSRTPAARATRSAGSRGGAAQQCSPLVHAADVSGPAGLVPTMSRGPASTGKRARLSHSGAQPVA